MTLGATEPIDSKPLTSLDDIKSKKRKKIVEKLIWGAYRRLVLETNLVQLSPTKQQILDAIRAKHEEMAKVIFWLADPIPQLNVRASTARRGERNVQFNNAIGQLLERRGYRIDEYRFAAEQALDSVRHYDRILTELNVMIEETINEDPIEYVSQSDLRYQFIQDVHEIFVCLSLPTDLGHKSMIV